MQWILIVWMFGHAGSTAITTAEFNSHSACTDALTVVKTKVSGSAAVCVFKGVPNK
jgi:hypothetical protein